MQSIETLKEYLGIVKAPFGSSADIATEFSASANADAVNYADGFPDKFATDPTGSGLYLLRGDFNRICEIVLREQYFRQCGGIHTFDAAVSSASGGYPLGAVLQLIDRNGICRQVISLVSNNDYDFIQNGVDHVHWEYCDDVPDAGQVSSIRFRPDMGSPTVIYEDEWAAPIDCFAYIYTDGNYLSISPTVRLIRNGESFTIPFSISTDADSIYPCTSDVGIYMKAGDRIVIEGRFGHFSTYLEYAKNAGFIYYPIVTA